MQTAQLKAVPRTETGTRVSRNLRAAGQLPAIIYGHGQTPEAVTVGTRALLAVLGHGARMVEIELNSKKMPYLIKEVQYDHLDHLPIHLDLTRVDLDERVTVLVSIELKGTAKGVNDGGVLEQIMNEIELDCLVTEIPDTLQPFVTDLGLGDALLVKDLGLPDGVTTSVGMDDKVAMVREAEEEEETEADADGEEAAEMPEIVGRVRSEEPEEDKK